MPLGQFTPGQALVEASTVFDNFTAFNRGIKAGTGFGAPTVAGGTAAGAGAAISGQRGTDFAGAFVVTAGTAPSPGTIATVTFANQLAVTPTSVIVNVQNQTGATALPAAPSAVATTGFGVEAGATFTATQVLNVTYLVIQ